MNPQFIRTPHARCPECGHSLHYVGRGHHECTNPECSVISVTLNRLGKQIHVVTQGPTLFGRENVPTYAVKQEALR